MLKRLKAIDMRFYQLRDRENQNLFNLYWSKGDKNLADYFTKHHPGTYHKKMRKILIASCLIGLIKQTFQMSEGVLNAKCIPYYTE